MTKDNPNYVYYVSDIGDVPVSGHFRKMDCEREIALHVCKGLDDCVVKKYTEYHGEVIDGTSVGIVFPAHRWGVSLSVLSFLYQLRVKKGVYVYAVAVGESLSGSVDETALKRIKLIEQFNRLFEKKGFGKEADVFVRCIDIKRPKLSTEEMDDAGCIKASVDNIMNGLLFHSVERLLEKKYAMLDNLGYYELEEERVVAITEKKPSTLRRNGRLTNVFLDEALWSEVRLCQVM